MKVSKKILITGGCGFVGRHLASYFLYNGFTVYIIDNLSIGIHPKYWLPPFIKLKKLGKNELVGKDKYSNVRFFFLNKDIIQFFLDHRSQEQFDYVIHLAAVIGGREVIEGDPIRVGTDLAIDALFFNWLVRLPHKPSKVIFSSSSSVYPIALQSETKRKALSETDISFSANYIGKPDLTYGWSKLTGEYLAHIASQKYGQKMCIIRPFSGYGEDQDLSYPIPSLMSQIAKKENPVRVWGDGNQGRDFIHISDCVRAYAFLLKQGRGKLITSNLGSGKLTTFRRVIHLGAKIQGYKPVIKPLIKKPIGVQTRYADMKHSPLYRSGFRQIITLEEGLTRVVSFMNSKNKNLSKLYESYYGR